MNAYEAFTDVSSWQQGTMSIGPGQRVKAGRNTLSSVSSHPLAATASSGGQSSSVPGGHAAASFRSLDLKSEICCVSDSIIHRLQTVVGV